MQNELIQLLESLRQLPTHVLIKYRRGYATPLDDLYSNIPIWAIFYMKRIIAEELKERFS